MTLLFKKSHLFSRTDRETMKKRNVTHPIKGGKLDSNQYIQS